LKCSFARDSALGWYFFSFQYFEYVPPYPSSLQVSVEETDGSYVDSLVYDKGEVRLKIRNERGDITTDVTEIQRLIYVNNMLTN
jgi:hypothetical protein